MAEVTKRKIASIYSLIAGFFLSLFSGHAHAGAFNYRKAPVEVGNTQVQTGKTSTQKAGVLMSPAPAGVLMSPAPAGVLMSPAPAGVLMSPAPDGAARVEIQNASEIEDAGMKTFVVEKAVEEGKRPDQLTTTDMNNLRTEYLLQQIKLLQNKVDQLQ